MSLEIKSRRARALADLRRQILRVAEARHGAALSAQLTLVRARAEAMTKLQDTTGAPALAWLAHVERLARDIAAQESIVRETRLTKEAAGRAEISARDFRDEIERQASDARARRALEQASADVLARQQASGERGRRR